MMKETTMVPNIVFDKLIAEITPSELQVLLVIIRQTNGWIDRRTGNRKTRDRITQRYFMRKTGLSRKTVSQAIQKLVYRRLISVTDSKGSILHKGGSRKGRIYLYYKVNLYKNRRQYACLDLRQLLST